jgi:hypothetical protein
VFAYSLSKQMELEDLNNELWLKEYKKKRRVHIQEIVESSLLIEQEKEWLEEYTTRFTTCKTYHHENKNVERIIMPNLFDIHKYISKNSRHSIHTIFLIPYQFLYYA